MVFTSRRFRSTAALSLVASLALSAPALAERQALSDSQLDGVTAGSAESSSASGGAIVAHDSIAELTSQSTVDLAGDAQADANGLNVVNSIESTVANGVNVWDGSVSGAAAYADGANFSVDQFNDVAQEQRRQATLGSYVRAGADVTESETSNSRTVTNSDRIESTQNLDLRETSNIATLDSTGNVDNRHEVLGQDVKAGVGGSGSGEINILLEGAEASYDLTASGRSTATVGEDGDSSALKLDITGDLAIHLGAEIKPIHVDINASACFVKLGSCSAEGNLNETDTILEDHSVISNLTDKTSSDVTNDTTRDSEIRGPVELAGAQAEYIVTDDSILTVNTSNAISLAGNAQKGLKGMNVVNAAGSAVANSVNIARTRSADLSVGSGQLLSLTQRNVIIHNR